MEKIRAKVNAKINLGLSITGKIGSMHTLDSLMHSVDVFDTVTLSTNGYGVYMNGELDPKNSVNKVLRMMEEYDLPKVRFDIDKSIPFCAGMGGSSADMSACIELVRATYGVDFDGILFGSDVPFMTKGGFARVTGIGDKIQYLEPLNLHLVIAKGDGGVNTKDAYDLFDKDGAKSTCEVDKILSALVSNDLSTLSEVLKNDLEKPAYTLNPDVLRVREHMSKYTPVSMMTGSGAAVFGVFESEEQARKAEIELGKCCTFSKYVKTLPYGVELL